MTTSYPRKSLGHVLHHLRKWGVPETIAGYVTLEEVTAEGGNLYQSREVFADFRYFDGIEQPLFRFSNRLFLQQQFVIADDQKFLRPEFRLSLGPHDNPALEIYGPIVSSELHKFISGVVGCQFVNEPEYKIKTAAAAFFQGGSAGPEERRIYIEFWKPDGAQAFIDYINTNYRQPVRHGDIAPHDNY